MRDKAIYGKAKMTFIDCLLLCVYITDFYTIATTKYVSSPCFSECQCLKEKGIENNVGIIGNDVRIK